MSDEFQIDPDAVRSVAGNIGGILMHAITLSRDLARLEVAPESFAAIGGAVSVAGASLHTEQVHALHSVLELVADINAEVSHAASANQHLDEQIAAGLVPSRSGLWSSPMAGQLASTAMADHAHQPGDGQSVDGVLGYLDRAGLGQLGSQPIAAGSFALPTALVDWLDTDPDHQTRIGVIGVYSGDSGSLADVPGGAHPGDLVYVARWQLTGPTFTPGTEATLGVLGDDGQLYNQGAISTTNWHGVTNLRVYRPLSEI